MTMSSDSEEYCRNSSARRRCLKKEGFEMITFLYSRSYTKLCRVENAYQCKLHWWIAMLRNILYDLLTHPVDQYALFHLFSSRL